MINVFVDSDRITDPKSSLLHGVALLRWDDQRSRSGVVALKSKRVLAILSAVLLAVNLMGCGILRGSHVPMESFTPFAESLKEKQNDKADFDLAELTTWEWDEVSLFYEGANAEEIEDETGYRIRDKYLYSPETLFFQLDGKVVKIIVIGSTSLYRTDKTKTYDHPGAVEFREAGSYMKSSTPNE
jgi:hypothetical protein